MTTIVFVFRDDDDDRRYHFNDNKNKNCITSTPAAVYFFQAGALFCTEKVTMMMMMMAMMVMMAMMAMAMVVAMTVAMMVMAMIVAMMVANSPDAEQEWQQRRHRDCRSFSDIFRAPRSCTLEKKKGFTNII